MPIDEARATFDAAFAGITKDIRPDEDIQTRRTFALQIQGHELTNRRTDDETMPNGQRMRIYIPKGVKEIMPVGLYIHSGGWYTGSVEIEDRMDATASNLDAKGVQRADFCDVRPHQDHCKEIEDSSFLSGLSVCTRAPLSSWTE